MLCNFDFKCTFFIAETILLTEEPALYGAPEIVNTQFIDAMENEISRTVTTDYQEAPQIHRCRQGEDLTLRGFPSGAA